MSAMPRLLMSEMLNSQLLLGLTVGGIIGIFIGAYCVRRAAGEQYTSLPMTVPAPETAEDKRRPLAGVYGRKAIVPTAPPESKIAEHAKFGGMKTMVEKTPATGSAPAMPVSQPSAGDLPEEINWLDAESGSDDATPSRGARVGTSSGSVAKPVLESCGQEVALKNDVIPKNDPVAKHYKKSGMLGSVTGMFGDKQTMYCHHITASGELAVRAAGQRRFFGEEEVWAFLGKRCCGRFAYNRSRRSLACGKLARGDHDNTCNAETCLFVKNRLMCPTPAWALK